MRQRGAVGGASLVRDPVFHAPLRLEAGRGDCTERGEIFFPEHLPAFELGALALLWKKVQIEG